MSTLPILRSPLHALLTTAQCVVCRLAVLYLRVSLPAASTSCNNIRFYVRFVTQLLKEIIFFVGDDQYNGGGKHGDPLEMDFTIKDRDRQKLLREQNILKQVE